jgi:hypothetical protein
MCLLSLVLQRHKSFFAPSTLPLFTLPRLTPAAVKSYQPHRLDLYGRGEPRQGKAGARIDNGFDGWHNCHSRNGPALLSAKPELKEQHQLLVLSVSAAVDM